MVSLMMERSLGMLISILAVLKAGATYVPVDPKFPPDRQSHIFMQSQSKVLIVDSEVYEHANSLGVQIPPSLIIDRNSGKVLYTVGLDNTENINICLKDDTIPSGDELAYILYTSGSTGKPKGVMITNKGVINQIEHFGQEMEAGPHTVVLGLATFCFDISVLEMYLALFHGGKLVIAASSTQKDPFRIIELIDKTGVNVFQATPTTYEMLLAIGWSGNSTINFLVGGEAFRRSLFPIIENCKSFRNLYGPTETTV
jgi:polyketide synthase PksJ